MLQGHNENQCYFLHTELYPKSKQEEKEDKKENEDKQKEEVEK